MRLWSTTHHVSICTILLPQLDHFFKIDDMSIYIMLWVSTLLWACHNIAQTNSRLYIPVFGSKRFIRLDSTWVDLSYPSLRRAFGIIIWLSITTRVIHWKRQDFMDVIIISKQHDFRRNDGFCFLSNSECPSCSKDTFISISETHELDHHE